MLNWMAPRGLERTINGIDRIRIIPDLYTIGESYEPDVWDSIMSAVRPGDVVVDVGAHIGLYTIAIASRLGSDGQIYAFEPDPYNLQLLRRHVELNGVGARASVFPYAVSDRDGLLSFVGGRHSQSHAELAPSESSTQVPTVTLDATFPSERVDLLKIDVEGFEVHVLRGATNLLGDARRGPRTIFIEVHPYAWEQFRVSSASLLDLLESYRYRVFDLAGNEIKDIVAYGGVVARRMTESC